MSGPCTYVSQTWGVHDQRWVTALQDLGFVVRVLTCDNGDLTLNDIREKLATKHGPVLAGPLTSVTRNLVGETPNLIGLSWAFDLLQPELEHKNLTWLQELDDLIVDSRVTQALAIASGLPDTRVHLIPWGTNLEVFTPHGRAMSLDRWGIPRSASVILSLRSLEHIYSIDIIIEAFSLVANQNPHAVLMIGNDGGLRDQLSSQAQSLGISERVKFIGRLPEDQLPDLLRASSVYVSASRIDGSSVTLLQAMACAVPVVAAATPGNIEWVIPGETGYLFTTGSPQDLAAALSVALQDFAQGDPQGMTTKARDLVQERADWNRNLRVLDMIMRNAQRGCR